MLNTIARPKEGEERSDFIGFGAARPLRTLKTPGDPGPADVRPVGDLAENIPAAPSASASAVPAPRAVVTGDAGDTGFRIGLGIGAAVLVGAAVAVPVLRSRRG